MEGSAGMDGIWLEVRDRGGLARDMVCKIEDQWAGAGGGNLSGD